eukprot:9116969-Pyramimonas_sp.AAC.1
MSRGRKRTMGEDEEDEDKTRMRMQMRMRMRRMRMTRRRRRRRRRTRRRRRRRRRRKRRRRRRRRKKIFDWIHARIPWLGHPRLYATWKDESLNALFAALAEMAHSGNWEQGVFARLDLQLLNEAGAFRPDK